MCSKERRIFAEKVVVATATFYKSSYLRVDMRGDYSAGISYQVF